MGLALVGDMVVPVGRAPDDRSSCISVFLYSRWMMAAGMPAYIWRYGARRPFEGIAVIRQARFCASGAAMSKERGPGPGRYYWCNDDSS